MSINNQDDTKDEPKTDNDEYKQDKIQYAYEENTNSGPDKEIEINDTENIRKTEVNDLHEPPQSPTELSLTDAIKDNSNEIDAPKVEIVEYKKTNIFVDEIESNDSDNQSVCDIYSQNSPCQGSDHDRDSVSVDIGIGNTDEEDTVKKDICEVKRKEVNIPALHTPNENVETLIDENELDDFVRRSVEEALYNAMKSLDYSEQQVQNDEVKSFHSYSSDENSCVNNGDSISEVPTLYHLYNNEFDVPKSEIKEFKPERTEQNQSNNESEQVDGASDENNEVASLNEKYVTVLQHGDDEMPQEDHQTLKQEDQYVNDDKYQTIQSFTSDEMLPHSTSAVEHTHNKSCSSMDDLGIHDTDELEVAKTEVSESKKEDAFVGLNKNCQSDRAFEDKSVQVSKISIMSNSNSAITKPPHIVHIETKEEDTPPLYRQESSCSDTNTDIVLNNCSRAESRSLNSMAVVEGIDDDAEHYINDDELEDFIKYSVNEAIQNALHELRDDDIHENPLPPDTEIECISQVEEFEDKPHSDIDDMKKIDECLSDDISPLNKEGNEDRSKTTGTPESVMSENCNTQAEESHGKEQNERHAASQLNAANTPTGECNDLDDNYKDTEELNCATPFDETQIGMRSTETPLVAKYDFENLKKEDANIASTEEEDKDNISAADLRHCYDVHKDEFEMEDISLDDDEEELTLTLINSPDLPKQDLENVKKNDLFVLSDEQNCAFNSLTTSHSDKEDDQINENDSQLHDIPLDDNDHMENLAFEKTEPYDKPKQDVDNIKKDDTFVPPIDVIDANNERTASAASEVTTGEEDVVSECSTSLGIPSDESDDIPKEDAIDPKKYNSIQNVESDHSPDIPSNENTENASEISDSPMPNIQRLDDDNTDVRKCDLNDAKKETTWLTEPEVHCSSPMQVVKSPRLETETDEKDLSTALKIIDEGCEKQDKEEFKRNDDFSEQANSDDNQSEIDEEDIEEFIRISCEEAIQKALISLEQDIDTCQDEEHTSTNDNIKPTNSNNGDANSAQPERQAVEIIETVEQSEQTKYEPKAELIPSCCEGDSEDERLVSEKDDESNETAEIRIDEAYGSESETEDVIVFPKDDEQEIPLQEEKEHKREDSVFVFKCNKSDLSAHDLKVGTPIEKDDGEYNHEENSDTIYITDETFVDDNAGEHSLPFGQEMRDSGFNMKPDVVNLNHASFGATPICIQDEQKRFLDEMESDTEEWNRYKVGTYIDHNVQAVADFVGAKANDVAFIESTVRGMKRVLAAIEFRMGDVIILNSWSMPGLVKLVKNVAKVIKGVEVSIVEIELPLKGKLDILTKYKRVLQFYDKTRLVILDHVSCAPAVVFPVQELAQLCRQNNTLCLVNGVHGPGHLPTNLSVLNPDFYIGNLSRWGFAAKGCAFLWVNPGHKEPQHKLSSTFRRDDEISGLPFFSTGSAVKFFKEIGGYTAIHHYCSVLLDTEVKKMYELWNFPQVLLPSDLQAPCMRNVLLPYLPGFAASEAGAKFLFSYLWTEHKIWAPVFFHNDRLWLRLSASIYTTSDDFEKLAKVIMKVREESLMPANQDWIKQGDWDI